MGYNQGYDQFGHGGRPRRDSDEDFSRFVSISLLNIVKILEVFV